MNKETFVTKAAAQQLNLSNMNVDMLKPEDMELILGGQCICCAGDTPIDVDYDDELRVIYYTQDLFCDGCADHIPAATQLAYGVISQETYDLLCNPFEDEVCPPTEYWESKWQSHEHYEQEDEDDKLRKEYLSTYPDASVGYDDWLYARMCMSQGKEQQSSAGGQFDCGDDELPF